MTYDHAQSPRLGQRLPPESPGIRMFNGTEIPEVSYAGQMIYRIDTQHIQVFNGTAWEDVVSGVLDQLTYVQPDPPVGATVNDLWYDSDANYALYAWDGTTWQPLLVTAEQIASGAITRDKLTLAAVDAAQLSSELTLTSKIILGQLDANGNIVGSYMVLDQHGAQLFNADGSPSVTMSTQDGSIPSFEGEVLASSLRVLGGLIMEETGNQIASGGQLELASTVKPPSTAAQLETYYESWQLSAPGTYAPHSSSPDYLGILGFSESLIEFLSWDSTLNKFAVGSTHTAGGPRSPVVTTGTRVWYFNTDGTLHIPAGDTSPLILDYADKISMSGYFRITPGATSRVYAYWNIPTGDYRAQVLCPDGTYRVNRIPAAAITDNTFRPYLTYNSALNQYLFGYNDNVGSNDKFKVARLTAVNSTGLMTFSSWLDTDPGTGRNGKTLGLMFGSQTGTASRYSTAFSTGTQGVVFSSVGAEIDAENFPLSSSGMLGFCHDGTNYFSVSSSGRLYKYSDWTWPSGNTMLHGYTWYNIAGGYETTLGGFSDFTLTKRANVRVTIPAAPSGVATNPPNGWRFYALKASSGGATSLWRQANGTSATPSSVVLSGLLTTGSHPPSSTTFPASTPAKVLSGSTDANGALIQMVGDGTGRWEYLVPAGSLVPWAGNQVTPPDGWLFADGSTKTRTTYPFLFSAIGTTYNTGGEAGTVFRLPNAADYGSLNVIIKT